MNEDLNLIERAFSDLEQHKNRFLECERAFRAEYEGEDNRTTKRKNSERSRSKLYIPLIKTTIFIIHAIFKTSFMSDRCPIEITRVGRRSDNDLILQNALTAVLKNRWKKKEHRVGLSKAVMSALYLPLGIVNLFYDKEQGDIATRFIPITDLAFDKHASDINDIEYVCYKWRQSVRQVEEKIKTKFYKSKDKDRILGSKTEWSQRVQMKDIYKKIYVNGRQMWELKSFANDCLVRETRFSTLPFHFGYCMDAMPSIDESTRENENAVYGSCVPEVVKEIQREYNIKRNQKIDITENQIDPSFIVDKTKGVVTISDVMARKKVIRVETDMGTRVSDVIMPFPVPPTYQLSEEIAMLSKEYEIATGVNSVMTGQTGPSDRRAMGALQTVNAASSMRIESMMQTLLETMLSSYAGHFVELLYRFVSDDEFIKITEDENIIEAIGTLTERKANRLDFDVSVNFGTTIANEVKISQLNGLLGVLAQNQISSPQITGEIVKEVLALILGENAPIEQVDQAMVQMMTMREAAQAEAVTQDEEAQIKNEPSEEDMEMAALVNGGI
nr:MAG TPA: Head tail connector [Caudoviricetes sp.]